MLLMKNSEVFFRVCYENFDRHPAIFMLGEFVPRRPQLLFRSHDTICIIPTWSYFVLLC